MSETGDSGTTVRPNFVRELFLTVLGSGYAPFASGSWGSLVSCGLFAALWWTVAQSTDITPENRPAIVAWIASVAIIVSAIMGIGWGKWAIARWGRKDPKPFVLDEFAGQWIALVWLPPVALGGWWPLACVLASQFFLFRLFDVLKPPPAHQIDRDWPDGWGIFCDDLVAGLYALIAGHLLWRLTPLAAWLSL